jgi:hypothetical protein
MSKEFNISHIGKAQMNDCFHLYVYSLKHGVNFTQIQLCDRFSTDSQGIALSLGLQSDVRVELDSTIKALEARISDKTSLNFS